MQNFNKTFNKLNCKASVITPFHVGKSFLIYNGKNFQNIFIHKKMVGYKFGIFLKTRKTFKFKKS